MKTGFWLKGGKAAFENGMSHGTGGIFTLLESRP